MKVVRIIARLNVGGPSRHVVWLTDRLTGFGMQTVLVAGTVPPTEQDMSYFAAQNGVEPTILPAMSRELSWRDSFVVGQLVRLYWKERPDVIHTHTAKAGAVGRAAAVVYRALCAFSPGRPRPLVVHTYHGHVFHGYYGALKNRLFLTIERALARVSDRIVVLSEQQRAEINETFRVGRRPQFAIVPLGIEVEAFRATIPDADEARRRFGIPGDEVVVGIVGRITAIKNHALFLDAFASLVRENSTATPLRALIVGDGDLRPETEQRATSLGVRDRVTYTGAQEIVGPAYAAMNVLVLTSRNEGTPLAIIEAMIAGTPVVSTPVGGVVDLLGPEDSSVDNAPKDVSIRARGVLVMRPDPDVIAAAIRCVLERPDLQRRLIAAGQDYARTTFSVERLLSDVAAVYRNAATV